jgi:hypothetical protein
LKTITSLHTQETESIRFCWEAHSKSRLSGKRGAMPIYINRCQVEKYWRENIQFKKFQGNKKEMKIMDRKIKNVIANKVLIETDKESARWCNQDRLVPNLMGSRYERCESIYEPDSF